MTDDRVVRLLEHWEYLYREQCFMVRNPNNKLGSKYDLWRKCLVRLLQSGSREGDIKFAMSRASNAQVPLDWPAPFKSRYHYLANPDAPLTPWVDKAYENNPEVQRMRWESSLENYYEQVRKLPPIPDYVSIDDILGLSERPAAVCRQ